MAAKHIAHVEDDPDEEVQLDAEGRQICPDCGDPMVPMTDDEIFAARMAAILDILDDVDPVEKILMLAIVAGEHIGSNTMPAVRLEMRSVLISIMDDNIKDTVAFWARRQHERQSLNRAGVNLDMMPDVPLTMN
jgi:hypothetical protein